MLSNRKRQVGFSLIELLIGTLVGLIVAAGAMTLYVNTLKGQSNNIKLARLNQDLRAMMDTMERDIRRAGFLTTNPDSYIAELKNNPFFDGATVGATTELAVYNGGHCIVYAYNLDNDAPPQVDGNERMGFRLSNAGELEMRSSGNSNDDCDDGAWESVTEAEVEITGLTFALSSTPLNVSSMQTDTDHDGCADGDDQDPASAGSPCITGHYGNKLCDTGESCNTCTRDGSPDPACLYVRNVTITLAGRLRSDPSIRQTITEQVRIRNDKFLDAIP